MIRELDLCMFFPNDMEDFITRLEINKRTAVRARLAKSGGKEFNIDGHKIWALNERNAKRKYENLIKSKS